MGDSADYGWVRACQAWQAWAAEILVRAGVQLEHGQWGDEEARKIIGQMAFPFPAPAAPPEAAP